MFKHRVGPLEAVGLRPFVPGLKQCKRALVGDEFSEPSRWGVSSLAIFRLGLGPATWAGWRARDRRVPVLNFFNHADAPPGGYDVRTTHARDFRGGRQTYNSHVGTDFVVPVGTRLCAPAPGRVVRVENLMYRGGLKIVIDHGEGLVTMSGHLARSLVQVGDEVARGQFIGLTGFSAIDGVLFFPWVPPHVHLTVLLNGHAVDPFADERDPHNASLWRGGNDPGPARPNGDRCRPPDRFDPIAVGHAIDDCRREETRAELCAMGDLALQAHTVHYGRLLDAGAFPDRTPLQIEQWRRAPWLDLPFCDDEVVGLRL